MFYYAQGYGPFAHPVHADQMGKTAINLEDHEDLEFSGLGPDDLAV